MTFGAEQQHLLGAGFVRQRRVGRTACVPPKPEAVAFLGQLLKTLFSKKLITHAEVGALNVLLGWHSSTTIFEDWAPWASSGMKASAEELAEAEAELLRAHAAGEPAAHKLRWLETFFVTVSARRLSCTGTSAATTMYEATEVPDLQHVCVDGLLAYYVRPGSTDGEHVTAPDDDPLHKYFGPFLFSLFLEDENYFFHLVKSKMVRDVFVKWLKHPDQHASAWELTDEVRVPDGRRPWRYGCNGCNGCNGRNGRNGCNHEGDAP